MHLMYFTEQPMSAYPEGAVGEDGVTALMFSNKNFDAVAGSQLYNERLLEYQLAEDVGFDGIMLNEHHDAPFCMQAQITVWASILATATERVKIVLLGTPLPTMDNPLAAAESLAMVDMISKGRLVAGIVRGAGTEQYANNVNPAFNRERFYEAHDLMVKAWTEPGPWRWEGDNYEFRVVNPWATPLQKPHPRIWVPGVASPETIVWCAQQRYPYVCLNTTIEQTKQIWKLYDDTAKEAGYESGPEHRGYLLRVHVQDTEEKAIANAREYMWMQGEFTGLGHPVWAAPTGYSSPTNREPILKRINGRDDAPMALPFEEQLEHLQIVAGTPDQVVERLRVLLEETRPGILALWANDGHVSHEDSKRCIELMGSDVLPALREIGDELELRDPFEADAPLSTKFMDPPRIPEGAPA
jgi:alkanesulfonate monooxygenase SsuD/methylene tetrahydromethanopterin reductase-like flavin-dependent oxidoreductase (luciferase family)